MKGGMPSQDSWMVSKTQYSQKEQQIRNKLFNISQKRAKEILEKEKEEDNKYQINPDTLKSMKDTDSIINAAKNYQVELSKHTDEKMHEFIDEMRSQFSNTTGQLSIPHHILYQQTRMLERQVNLLEANQKTLMDVLNNNLNATGKDGSFAIRQEINNQNRSMMMDIIAPLNQRWMEMKVLYENTKSWSEGVGGKIDELKNVIAQYQSSGLSGPMLSSTIGRKVDPYSEQLGDPKLFIENLEHIKSRMQEIKDESLAIEHDMDGRFKTMTRIEQQRKYLPKTITEDIAEAKLMAKTNPQITELLTGFDVTRKAVIEKLGGEFDYDSFDLDLKDILAEKNSILEDFRNAKLEVPPPAPKGVEKYNFKSRPLQPKIKPPVQDQKSKTVKIPEKESNDEPSISIKEEIIKKPNIIPPVGAEPPRNMTRTQPVGAQGRGRPTTNKIQVIIL